MVMAPVWKRLIQTCRKQQPAQTPMTDAAAAGQAAAAEGAHRACVYCFQPLRKRLHSRPPLLTTAYLCQLQLKLLIGSVASVKAINDFHPVCQLACLRSLKAALQSHVPELSWFAAAALLPGIRTVLGSQWAWHAICIVSLGVDGDRRLHAGCEHWD